jgi:thioredoxin-related protein
MLRLIAALALASALCAADPNWETGWTETSAAAKIAEKPILADFTGSDWCGWCVRLKKEVFDTPEFKAWADKRVVLLEVDFPNGKKLPDELAKENEALMNKYGIQGFPTIVFLDAEGKELGRLGYQKGGPKPWIAAADAILDKGK